MLEIYNTNVAVEENSFVPFDSVAIKKGCTSELSGTNTIKLNRCGVYMVSVDASAEESTTLQLYKNGIAQAQAQSTGGTPAFTTLVQVNENNSNCPCASAVTLQIMNTTATTLSNINCVVTKVC